MLPVHARNTADCACSQSSPPWATNAVMRRGAIARPMPCCVAIRRLYSLGVRGRLRSRFLVGLRRLVLEGAITAPPGKMHQCGHWWRWLQTPERQPWQRSRIHRRLRRRSTSPSLRHQFPAPKTGHRRSPISATGMTRALGTWLELGDSGKSESVAMPRNLGFQDGQLGAV